MKHREVIEAARATLDRLDEEGLIDVYDPVTCITAGELRAIGWAILETIPDCGWVKWSSWDVTCDVVVSMDDDGSMDVDIKMGFREAFQWLEFKFTVEKLDG